MLAKADSKRRERRPKGGKGGMDAAVSDRSWPVGRQQEVADRKASPISTSTTLSDRTQRFFSYLIKIRKRTEARLSSPEICRVNLRYQTKSTEGFLTRSCQAVSSQGWRVSSMQFFCLTCQIGSMSSFETDLPLSGLLETLLRKM